MAIEIKETVFVCIDCCSWLANGDATSLDYYCPDEKTAAVRLEEIQTGERELIGFYPGGQVVAGDSENDDEFARSPCGCCGCRLHGSRHEFHILGRVKP